jgi:lanosterol synthase
MSRQQPTGEWLQEDVEGVFNGTWYAYSLIHCSTNSYSMIGYPNYKYYFPVWALGKYAHSYQPMIKALKEVMGDDV